MGASKEDLTARLIWTALDLQFAHTCKPALHCLTACNGWTWHRCTAGLT